jgi:hypothetical protein
MTSGTSLYASVMANGPSSGTKTRIIQHSQSKMQNFPSLSQIFEHIIYTYPCFMLFNNVSVLFSLPKVYVSVCIV